MCGRYYIEIDNLELQSIIAAVENKAAKKLAKYIQQTLRLFYLHLEPKNL